MSYDKKCKWHKSCGYDFCHGEGICPEFEKGKSPKETEKEGKVVMHISSPDILTQESIDFWEKEYGMKMTCSKCGKRLEPGDQKDHYWPYFSDYNRCKKCIKKEKT